MIQKEYISKDHSKFLIKYHMILVCKYRKKLLVGAVEYDMKRIMQDISDLSDFNIEVMETDKGHIHMMICSEPKTLSVANSKETKTNVNNCHLEKT